MRRGPRDSKCEHTGSAWWLREARERACSIYGESELNHFVPTLCLSLCRAQAFSVSFDKVTPTVDLTSFETEHLDSAQFASGPTMGPADWTPPAFVTSVEVATEWHFPGTFSTLNPH
jgi:hypothetical protein